VVLLLKIRVLWDAQCAVDDVAKDGSAFYFRFKQFEMTLAPEREDTRSFTTLSTTRPVAQGHVLEDMDPQPSGFELATEVRMTAGQSVWEPWRTDSKYEGTVIRHKIFPISSGTAWIFQFK